MYKLTGEIQAPKRDSLYEENDTSAEPLATAPTVVVAVTHLPLQLLHLLGTRQDLLEWWPQVRSGSQQASSRLINVLY